MGKKDVNENTPTMLEVYEDLCCRFVVNIPAKEFHPPERICFQVEMAHWFYTDYYLPKYGRLKKILFREFCLGIFGCSLILKKFGDNVDLVLRIFNNYKRGVPICGAVLLNPEITKCVVVRGFYTNNNPWSLPKGKINEGETRADCAAREVLEEVGYDIAGKINEKLTVDFIDKGKSVHIYIITDVDEETVFSTHTKGEIACIEWYDMRNIHGTHTGDFSVSKLLWRVVLSVKDLLQRGILTVKKASTIELSKFALDIGLKTSNLFGEFRNFHPFVHVRVNEM